MENGHQLLEVNSPATFLALKLGTQSRRSWYALPSVVYTSFALPPQWLDRKLK